MPLADEPEVRAAREAALTRLRVERGDLLDEAARLLRPAHMRDMTELDRVRAIHRAVELLNRAELAAAHIAHAEGATWRQIGLAAGMSEGSASNAWRQFKEA